MATTTDRMASGPAPRRAGPLRIILPSRRTEPAPGEERRPALRIVPRARRRRRAGFLAALICLAVFGVMFGLVAFQAKIATDQLRLDRVEKDLSQAQATYERLRLNVAQLESPETVISAAKERGMVVPDKVAYVTPSVADVLAVAMAEGRGPAPTGTAATGDTSSGWAAVKPIVGGTP
jgi:cell division protein FtsL